MAQRAVGLETVMMSTGSGSKNVEINVRGGDGEQYEVRGQLVGLVGAQVVRTRKTHAAFKYSSQGDTDGASRRLYAGRILVQGSRPNTRSIHDGMICRRYATRLTGVNADEEKTGDDHITATRRGSVY